MLEWANSWKVKCTWEFLGWKTSGICKQYDSTSVGLRVEACYWNHGLNGDSHKYHKLLIPTWGEQRNSSSAWAVTQLQMANGNRVGYVYPIAMSLNLHRLTIISFNLFSLLFRFHQLCTGYSSVLWTPSFSDFESSKTQLSN